jgi:hypothetical protein
MQRAAGGTPSASPPLMCSSPSRTPTPGAPVPPPTSGLSTKCEFCGKGGRKKCKKCEAIFVCADEKCLTKLMAEHAPVCGRANPLKSDVWYRKKGEQPSNLEMPQLVYEGNNLSGNGPMKKAKEDLEKEYPDVNIEATYNFMETLPPVHRENLIVQLAHLWWFSQFTLERSELLEKIGKITPEFATTFAKLYQHLGDGEPKLERADFDALQLTYDAHYRGMFIQLSDLEKYMRERIADAMQEFETFVYGLPAEPEWFPAALPAEPTEETGLWSGPYMIPPSVAGMLVLPLRQGDTRVSLNLKTTKPQTFVFQGAPLMDGVYGQAYDFVQENMGAYITADGGPDRTVHSFCFTYAQAQQDRTTLAAAGVARGLLFDISAPVDDIMPRFRRTQDTPTLDFERLVSTYATIMGISTRLTERGALLKGIARSNLAFIEQSGLSDRVKQEVNYATQMPYVLRGARGDVPLLAMTKGRWAKDETLKIASAIKALEYTKERMKLSTQQADADVEAAKKAAASARAAASAEPRQADLQTIAASAAEAVAEAGATVQAIKQNIDPDIKRAAMNAASEQAKFIEAEKISKESQPKRGGSVLQPFPVDKMRGLIQLPLGKAGTDTEQVRTSTMTKWEKQTQLMQTERDNILPPGFERNPLFNGLLMALESDVVAPLARWIEELIGLPDWLDAHASDPHMRVRADDNLIFKSYEESAKKEGATARKKIFEGSDPLNVLEEKRIQVLDKLERHTRKSFEYNKKRGSNLDPYRVTTALLEMLEKWTWLSVAIKFHQQIKPTEKTRMPGEYANQHVLFDMQLPLFTYRARDKHFSKQGGEGAGTTPVDRAVRWSVGVFDDSKPIPPDEVAHAGKLQRVVQKMRAKIWRTRYCVAVLQYMKISTPSLENPATSVFVDALAHITLPINDVCCRFMRRDYWIDGLKHAEFGDRWDEANPTTPGKKDTEIMYVLWRNYHDLYYGPTTAPAPETPASESSGGRAAAMSMKVSKKLIPDVLHKVGLTLQFFEAEMGQVASSNTGTHLYVSTLHALRTLLFAGALLRTSDPNDGDVTFETNERVSRGNPDVAEFTKHLKTRWDAITDLSTRIYDMTECVENFYNSERTTNTYIVQLPYMSSLVLSPPGKFHDWTNILANVQLQGEEILATFPKAPIYETPRFQRTFVKDTLKAAVAELKKERLAKSAQSRRGTKRAEKKVEEEEEEEKAGGREGARKDVAAAAPKAKKRNLRGSISIEVPVRAVAEQEMISAESANPSITEEGIECIAYCKQRIARIDGEIMKRKRELDDAREVMKEVKQDMQVQKQVGGLSSVSQDRYKDYTEVLDALTTAGNVYEQLVISRELYEDLIVVVRAEGTIPTEKVWNATISESWQALMAKVQKGKFASEYILLRNLLPNKMLAAVSAVSPMEVQENKSTIETAVAEIGEFVDVAPPEGPEVTEPMAGPVSVAVPAPVNPLLPPVVELDRVQMPQVIAEEANIVNQLSVAQTMELQALKPMTVTGERETTEEPAGDPQKMRITIDTGTLGVVAAVNDFEVQFTAERPSKTKRSKLRRRSPPPPQPKQPPPPPSQQPPPSPPPPPPPPRSRTRSRSREREPPKVVPPEIDQPTPTPPAMPQPTLPPPAIARPTLDDIEPLPESESEFLRRVAEGIANSFERGTSLPPEGTVPMQVPEAREPRALSPTDSLDWTQGVGSQTRHSYSHRRHHK